MSQMLVSEFHSTAKIQNEIPVTDKLGRIGSLQERISEAGIDVVLLNYSRSLLYYGGSTQPSILIITPVDYHLFVIRGLNSAVEETWLDHQKISSGDGYQDVKKMLKNWRVNRGRLGMELDILPAVQYRQFSRLLPGFDIVDISRLILEQRKIKDEKEIEYTREACRIVHAGHKRLLEVLVEGMTELELSAEIEDAQRRAGHEGLYFVRQFDFFMGRGPLASGENLSKVAGKIRSITGVGLSPSVPMGASLKKIKKGEMIVVDIPANYQGYHCDQSRTYVLGSPPDTCNSMYEGMKEIADRIIRILKPEIQCGQLYERASTFADELGLGPYFMRLGDNSKKVSFIGHGVGLEANEPPMIGKSNDEALKEGMIIALELEMCGSVGEVVKLEDTILITSDGCEILTVTPRHMHQISHSI